MPRYFFVLRGPDDEKHDDLVGTELPDKSGAVAYARKIVSELKEAGGYDDPGWILIVKDQTGDWIADVRFTDRGPVH